MKEIHEIEVDAQRPRIEQEPSELIVIPRQLEVANLGEPLALGKQEDVLRLRIAYASLALLIPTVVIWWIGILVGGDFGDRASQMGMVAVPTLGGLLLICAHFYFKKPWG